MKLVWCFGSVAPPCLDMSIIWAHHWWKVSIGTLPPCHIEQREHHLPQCLTVWQHWQIMHIISNASVMYGYFTPFEVLVHAFGDGRHHRDGSMFTTVVVDKKLAHPWQTRCLAVPRCGSRHRSSSCWKTMMLSITSSLFHRGGILRIIMPSNSSIGSFCLLVFCTVVFNTLPASELSGRHSRFSC